MEENKQPTTEQASTTEEPSKMGGLKTLGLGLIGLGLAYYFFTTMTKYESGEGIRMNSILLIAYKIAGKNIATGIIAALGTLMAYSGIKEFISSKN